MKKLIACLTLLIALPLMAIAQEVAYVEVSGKVMDTEYQQPLEGCHIYINDHYGTVSDEKGLFTLAVPVSQLNRDLQVSYMGYETASKPVSEMVNRPYEFDMMPSAIVLDEVVVIADPWKNFRDIVSYLSTIYPDKEELMAAILNELDRIENEEIPSRIN